MILQIPVSLYGWLFWRLAIILTGAGAALTVDMNLIANPGDGFVQAVSMRIGKDLGTAKNLVDISCVIVSTLIGFAAAGRLVGVGLGTLIAMIGVGRVIALFNHLFQEETEAAGISRLRHGGACGKLHAQKAPGGLFCADPPGSFLFLPLFSLISAVHRFYLSQSLICSYTPFPSSLYFSSSFTAGPDSQ